MNAQELTVVVNNLHNKVSDLMKRIDYLEQRTDKHELKISDMKVDIELLEHSRR